VSSPVYAYAVPLALLREARRGGEAAASVRAALGAKITEPVERFLTGAPLTDGNETVEVIERLCRALGRPLPGNLGGGISVKLMERVDEQLAQAGLPQRFQMTNLVFGGSPVRDLPWPEESPSVGYIEPEVLAIAIERFASDPPTSEDVHVDGVLSLIEDWLVLCRQWQTEEPSPLGLVGIGG
jgi:hypothetical protein